MGGRTRAGMEEIVGNARDPFADIDRETIAVLSGIAEHPRPRAKIFAVHRIPIDRLQLGQILECTVTEMRQFFGKPERNEVRAISKCSSISAICTIGNFKRTGGVVRIMEDDRGQRAATVERRPSDKCDRGGDNQVHHSVAVLESVITDRLQTFRQGKFFDLLTAVKRVIADGSHRGRNCYAGQRCAVLESVITDRLQTFRQGKFFDLLTAVKRIGADRSHPARNGNACQPRAAVERVVADRSDPARNGNACQACAVLEGVVADGSDPARNGNACQACVALEGIFINAVGLAVEGGGKGDGGIRSDISDQPDVRAVVVEDEAVLRGRQVGGVGIGRDQNGVCRHAAVSAVPRRDRERGEIDDDPQLGAVFKGVAADGLHICGNGELDERRAVFEGLRPDFRNACGKVDAGERGAVAERSFPDGLHLIPLEHYACDLRRVAGGRSACQIRRDGSDVLADIQRDAAAACFAEDLRG